MTAVAVAQWSGRLNIHGKHKEKDFGFVLDVSAAEPSSFVKAFLSQDAKAQL